MVHPIPSGRGAKAKFRVVGDVSKFGTPKP